MLARVGEMSGMVGMVPAHGHELLLLLREVGSELAGSAQVTERVWGLHLLEDWKTLRIWAEREETGTETEQETVES